ncbi:phosphatidate cytidylyltransferase [Marinomonas agarivorans]|nr:phosphatidate cytidylyltransferase [Marinomonas agarivorans]
MLLPRILSAIVMACIFISAVLFLSEISFAMFVGLVSVLAAWEWARLSGLTRQQPRIAFAGMVGTLAYGIAIFQLQQLTLWLAPIFWLVALYWVAVYPSEKSWRHTGIRLLFGLVILLTTWSALVVLRQAEHFFTYLLVLMGVIWGADTGAYCFGRLFGKHKLARHVSPGKSWEGVAGGLLVTQIGLAVFAFYQEFTLETALQLAFIGLITASVSVLGDLTESLFKRHEGLKDSSHLIPGHGGVMDRLDSVMSAAPLFVLLLIVFGWL